MSTWHNRLGEDGQCLTILSVLPRAPFDGTGPDAELSLREAIEELFRIAGEDGQAQVVMDVRVHDDLPEFTIEENVTLRELADRLYDSYGADGQSSFLLRMLGPDDDPLGAWPMPATVANGADDIDHGPLAGLLRFREAVHRLFGGSSEAATPPTVLSLLVGPPAADTRIVSPPA